MKAFNLINIQWNKYNGFIFSIIEIDLNEFNGELFGVDFSKNHFILSILFYRIYIL